MSATSNPEPSAWRLDYQRLPDDGKYVSHWYGPDVFSSYAAAAAAATKLTNPHEIILVTIAPLIPPGLPPIKPRRD